MTAIPESPQRTAASFPALLWLCWWMLIAITFAFSSNFILFAVFTAVALLGWLPTYEGPLFLAVYRKLRVRWKIWRMGTTHRRTLSSTHMVYQQGVTQLKGLFKVDLALLEFKADATNFLQIPVLLNGRRHTIIVESGSNPVAALADEDERDMMREQEAELYVDLAEELGKNGALTIWSLHRRPDRSADMMYLQERLEPEIAERRTPQAKRALQEHLDSTDEIVEGNWDRRMGISLTADNPPSWNLRKLNKLTADELQESPAVKAALIAEDKMEGAGIADAQICSYPSFNRLMREVFSVKSPELPRDRAQRDIVEETLAALEGERMDIRDMFAAEETPFPTMQRELANDYMIFDGTYHRVMWITHYLSKGSYDALHTARCDYYVGIYADIKSARQDDSRRQDKGRLLGQLLRMKRNLTAQDEEELEKLDAERYDALEYGQYVPYFRTLIIVSGGSLKEMEESQKTLLSHLARNNVRVQMHVPTGGDQLAWFFAALGSFGPTKLSR